MDVQAPDAPPPDPRGRAAPRPSLLLTLVMIAILGVLAWMAFRPLRGPTYDPDAAPRTVTPRGDLADSERSTIALFRAASPSVVHVANLAILRDRFSRDLLEIPRGSGSGFVWDARGYVVTNAHVVRDGDRFVVTFADHTTLGAFLVGVSPDHDLAVLKVESPPAAGLPPLAIGTSDDLQVGQSVFAIGNPFGLDQTLTTGIISGLDREIRSDTGQLIRGTIQTDAAINPGNSGGPLLDSAGRVIGINTAIFSRSGQYSGVGFAVPVDTVNRVVPSLIRGEKPRRAGFGVLLMRPAVEADLGIRSGVGIDAVLPDSAAEKAGMHALRRDPETGRLRYDVITALDGEAVTTRERLFDLLSGHEIGDEVTITVRRDGDARDLKVTLQGVGP